MKRTIALALLFLSTLTHAQNYKWVKGGGSTTIYTSSLDRGELTKYMCTDDNGNVYVAANMGVTNILADTFYRAIAHNYLSGNLHIMIASYDCIGNMRWAKLIEGHGESKVGGIKYFKGGIYLTGWCPSNPLTYYKHFGEDTIITSNNYASYMARFDTGNNGDTKWIRFVGSDVYGNDMLAFEGKIAIDGQGYVHNFALVKAGCNLTSSITTTAAGTYDLKYDTLGNLVNVSQIGALDSVWSIGDAIYNKQTGSWFATVAPSDFWYATIGYIFNSAICKFRSDNTLAWIDTTGPNGGVAKVDYDGGKFVYLTGSGQTGSYDIGGLTIDHMTGGKHTSVIKLDTNDVGIWAYTLSGSTAICGLGHLCLLADGKIAATGNIGGMGIHGSDTIKSTVGEGQNGMLAIIDTGGHTIKLDEIHGAGFYDFGNAITSDKIGNVYVGGLMQSNIWGGSLTPYVSNGGNSDYFIMKYGYDCSCTSVPTASYTSTVSGASTLAFTFTGTSGYDSVRWQFGDGGTSAAASPTHTYAAPGTYTVCVRVFTPCGSNTYCGSVVVPTVGVPQLAAGSVSVYPNPATDELIITGHSHQASYRLMSITGATVQQGSLPAQKATIRLANQTPGMYVLEVTEDNGERSIVRIVKE